MSYRSRIFLCVAFLSLFGATCCTASGDGVDVLFMLCEPYGANTALLWNNFERLGWNVTIAGTDEEAANCSFLTTPVRTARTFGEIESISGFDVVAVSSTPGTFSRRPNPAMDLRGDEHVLDLIREADRLGVTLFAGCSGLMVFGDAGILAGRDVVTHATLHSSCVDYGGTCIVGDFNNPPRIDENLVTATNLRFYALEIPEAIARSLDRLDDLSSQAGWPSVRDLSLTPTDVPPGGAVVAARAWGTPAADGALDVCALDDGFVVAGYTFANGNTDALVARFDSSGQIVWAKSFGGPGRDYAYGVVATSDGAIAVAGMTTSVGAGGEDAFLVKLSAFGDPIWAKTYGAEGHDAAFALTTTADGGFALTGSFETSETRHSALFVTRTDAAGKETWSATYDGRRNERGLSILEREDGSLIVAGGTSSFGGGNYDMILVALSSTGEELWRQAEGRKTFDIAEALIEAENGDLLAIGYGDVEGGDPNDVQLVRFDANGERQWVAREGPKKSFDYGQALLELPSGDLFTLGVTGAGGTGKNDVCLQKYSSEGELLWEQIFGDDLGSEWANGLCRMVDGRIAACGWTLAVGVGSQDLLLAFVDPKLAR